MMGSRGPYSGDESDAFSRRSRRMLRWGRQELKRIKRGFAKRSRRIARLSIGKDQSQ
jgi:hypothetical protein